MVTLSGAQRHEVPFGVEVVHRDGVSALTVSGELDMATVPLLRDVALDADRCPGPAVVLDLRTLTFIDSMGVGAIVRIHREVLERSGTLRVRCAEGPVSTVFRVTGLDRILDLEIDPPGHVSRPSA